MQDLRDEIGKAEIKLATLRASANASAARLTGMPSGSATSRNVEETSIRIIAAEKQLKLLRQRYHRAQVETARLLSASGIRGKTLAAIKKHYINGETWVQIGREWDCDPNTLRVKVRRVLNKTSKVS